MPKTQVTVGNAYRYDVKAILPRRGYANDTDGDLLTYSLDADSLAKGMSIRMAALPGSQSWAMSALNLWW
jgi:hypothetical protein